MTYIGPTDANTTPQQQLAAIDAAIHVLQMHMDILANRLGTDPRTKATVTWGWSQQVIAACSKSYSSTQDSLDDLYVLRHDVKDRLPRVKA
jgi:hypothetical protein